MNQEDLPASDGLPAVPPTPRRRMRQPTKDYIRAELRLAEREIEHLRAENARLRRQWWNPMTWRKAA